jgi:signal transduction histidine kinase
MPLAMSRRIMEDVTNIGHGPSHTEVSDVEVRRGIAHIIGVQSEASYLLKDLTGSNSPADGSGISPISHLHLFYNLEDVFSQIAHEGRNYLSPIKGYASLIAEGAASGAYEQQWADKIVHSIRLMERYFVQLDLFRMKGISQVETVQWATFLDGVLESFVDINKKSMPVEIVNTIKEEVTVHAELLKRVILHILKNAYESMNEEGTIRIESSIVRSEEAHAPRGGIALKVIDQGGGIIEEKRDHIWKPFFTTKPNHFGLGLPYVSMASSMLGAQMELNSKEGEGTTFALILKPEGEHIETA